jgi:hypothetical protein
MRLGFWLAFGTIVLLAATAIVAAFTNAPNQGFRDGAAVLAVITATAIGIERLMEGAWTVVDMSPLGSFWPAKQIKADIDSIVDSLNDVLTPVYQKAHDAIDHLEHDTEEAQKRIASLHNQLDDDRQATQDVIKNLREQAPSNQRIQLMAAAADHGLSRLSVMSTEFFTEVAPALAAARQATADIGGFVEKFKDNPGRRLISLYLGALFGLLVAGFIGLDAFAATLGTNVISSAGPKLGVAATGIVMGLGSNPTHELIGALKSLKSSGK